MQGTSKISQLNHYFDYVLLAFFHLVAKTFITDRQINHRVNISIQSAPSESFSGGLSQAPSCSMGSLGHRSRARGPSLGRLAVRPARHRGPWLKPPTRPCSAQQAFPTTSETVTQAGPSARHTALSATCLATISMIGICEFKSHPPGVALTQPLLSPWTVNLPPADVSLGCSLPIPTASPRKH